jgi:hypothetical protein
MGRRMSKIIGVAGQMRSGKDTIADHIVEKFSNSWRRVAFATGVKRVYSENFDKDYDFIEEWKVKSDTPDGFSKTVRQSLQFIGDGFRQINPNIWIDLLFRKEVPPYVVSDVRYINECRQVKEHGGFTVLVWRPDFENDDPNGSEAQLKPIIDFLKNTNIDGCISNADREAIRQTYYGTQIMEVSEHIDFFIRNNGTKEELYKKLDEKVIPYVTQ